MFHALMALLYNEGHVVEKGMSEQKKKTARFRNTFASTLVIDDDGNDLYKVDGESIKKLAAMQNSELSSKAAIALMKTHYLKVDGTQQPACFICGEVGHQGCACLKFLKLCELKGIISAIPAVSSTKYTFGHPADLCAGELVEVQYDLSYDSDDEPRSGAVQRLVYESTSAEESGEEIMMADCADNATTRTAGVTIHHDDDSWPLGMMHCLRQKACKYLWSKVDKVFDVQPDWRPNADGVLLPHVEDAFSGYRTIGSKEASAELTTQVMEMLMDKVPKHGGRPLSCYRSRGLKPIFRHPDCPEQPVHRDGAHGLAVIIPMTKSYVIHIYPWRSADDYAAAGVSMNAQLEGTVTDRVYGPPQKVTADPGDVIIFDKRLGHCGGRARRPQEIKQDGDDTSWLPVSKWDHCPSVTDAAWHLHLDDHEHAESLRHDGEDPAYYVYPSVPSDEGMTIDDLKAATLEEIRLKGDKNPRMGLGQPPGMSEPTWSYEDFPDLRHLAPSAWAHAELLASDLSPVPRQVVIMFFGPGGRPLYCLVDSGASRTFMLESIGIQLALENADMNIRRPVKDLKLRLADGQISGDTINKEIKNVQYSQLNGKIKGKHDVMLLPSMPPGIDVILARDFIFNSLNAVITADSLICYATKPLDGDFGRRLPETDESKWQSLDFETPAGFDVATMCLEQALDGQAISVTECGPIDEIAFAGGETFDDLSKTALTDFVRAALAVKPKKRSKSQRDAVALLRSLDQLPEDVTAPDLHTGPMPVSSNGDTAVTGLTGPRPLPRQNKVFPAIAQAVASLLLLLSCGGGGGAMVDAAELASISIDAPEQWVWLSTSTSGSLRSRGFLWTSTHRGLR